MRQLVGYSAEELEQIDWARGLTPTEWLEQEEEVLHKLETTGIPVRYEKEYIRKDGTRVPVEMLVHLIRDENGEPLHYYAFLTDITDRKKSENRIKSSLKEKEVLLKEIHHRVKNNMQIISSLLSLQTGGMADPNTKAVLTDLGSRVHAMAMVHEKLYQAPDLANLDFMAYVENLMHYLLSVYDTNTSPVHLNLALSPVALTVDTAIPCGLILTELVSNALKHAFEEKKEGEVTVSLHADDRNRVHMAVSDNGRGLPADMDWRETSSLGLRLVDMLIRQLNADIQVHRKQGTEFRIVTQPVSK